MSGGLNSKTFRPEEVKVRACFVRLRVRMIEKKLNLWPFLLIGLGVLLCPQRCQRHTRARNREVLEGGSLCNPPDPPFAMGLAG
jgi:hypothetical protein